MNKTPLMTEVERRHGEPLETLLPRTIAEVGIVEAGEKLGISRSTISYWMLKLGYQRQAAYLQRDQAIKVVKRRE